MRFGTVMAAAAFALGIVADVVPSGPSYNRRRRKSRDKHTQAYLTVTANRGRLTKRGKRGYGLTPTEVRSSRTALYLNSHERDMVALRAALA